MIINATLIFISKKTKTFEQNSKLENKLTCKIHMRKLIVHVEQIVQISIELSKMTSKCHSIRIGTD